MARRTRKRKEKTLEFDELKKQLLPLVRRVAPNHILEIMSQEYEKYIRASRSDAEQEFWIKAARSTANLASGMEKWVEEWIDEEEDDEKGT